MPSPPNITMRPRDASYTMAWWARPGGPLEESPTLRQPDRIERPRRSRPRAGGRVASEHDQRSARLDRTPRCGGRGARDQSAPPSRSTRRSTSTCHHTASDNPDPPRRTRGAAVRQCPRRRPPATGSRGRDDRGWTTRRLSTPSISGARGARRPRSRTAGGFGRATGSNTRLCPDRGPGRMPVAACDPITAVPPREQAAITRPYSAMQTTARGRSAAAVERLAL